MQKTQPFSQQFKDSILTIPSSENLPLRSGLKEVADTATIVRNIGRRIARIEESSVWGIAKDRMEGVGVTAVSSQRADASDQNGVANGFELYNDGQINACNSFLLVSYGAGREGYGVGPTRDPRRAAYRPGLLIMTENAELGTKGAFSAKLSPFTGGLIDRICTMRLEKPSLSPYGSYSYESFGMWPSTIMSCTIELGPNRGVYFSTVLSNVYREGRSAFADVGIFVSRGFQSGWDFLPPDVAVTSPFFGGIGTVMDEGDYIRSTARLGEWIIKSFGTIRKVSDQIMQAAKSVPMLFIENT